MIYPTMNIIYVYNIYYKIYGILIYIYIMIDIIFKYMEYSILVGGLEHEFYDFPSIGNVIIPTDDSSHFSEG